MKKKKKSKGLDAVKARYGYIFVAHWIFGLIVFFAFPLISSVRYAFSNVSIGDTGLEIKLAGFKNFAEIFGVDANYLNNLRDSIGSIIYSIPVIIALSLIVAVLLNQQFAGRTLYRAIYFLPIIISGSVVMYHMTGAYVQAPLFTFTSGDEFSYGSLIDFKAIIEDLSLPTQISDLLSSLLGNIFGLIWNTGVPTVLFLAGLQSISPSLYEVSKIEGANKWEEFWYITIPMLRNVITLVIIYTMIDLFTALNNPVMTQAYSLMQNKQVYDTSSAMLWTYFGVVGILMIIVLGIYNRFCLRKWE